RYEPGRLTQAAGARSAATIAVRMAPDTSKAAPASWPAGRGRARAGTATGPMVVVVSSALVAMEEPRPTAEVTERVVELLRQNVGSGALSLDEFSSAM